MVSLEFFDIILPTYGPGVDSTSSRNEYQEYFLGVKADGAYGWQPYHIHVPTVFKSGSLDHLEPWGPVQACTGIALPLPSLLFVTHYITHTGQDSVVSIVNWYGLEGPGIESRGAHPASCTMGTQSPFRGKAAGVWHWPPTPIYTCTLPQGLYAQLHSKLSYFTSITMWHTPAEGDVSVQGCLPALV
jgi:hypothetical protein